MLGYNLLGYSSIMEIDRHQVQILVPVLTMSLTNSAPSSVAGGASISPPTIYLTNLGGAPADVQSGAQLQIPLDEIEFVPQIPGISISANIYPPLTSVEYIPQAPSVWAGSIVRVDYKILTITIAAPFATAGKSVFHPPVVEIEFVPQVPGISISSNNHVPAKTLTLTPFAPEKVGGGVLIEVGVIDVNYDLGGIGDTLIGEFSIGEGRVITKTVDKVLLLNFLIYAPQDIQGGAQILLPEALTMSLVMQTAEIDSRRRKLRAQVILS